MSLQGWRHESTRNAAESRNDVTLKNPLKLSVSWPGERLVPFSSRANLFFPLPLSLSSPLSLFPSFFSSDVSTRFSWRYASPVGRSRRRLAKKVNNMQEPRNERTITARDCSIYGL